MNTINKYLETEPNLKKCVVSYLIDQKENKVLLIERLSSSNDLGVNKIAGIGGKLQQGETADEALVRDVQEETGLIITKFKEMGRVVFLFPNNTKWNQDVAVYVGTEWQGEPTESKESRPSWFPIDEIPFDRMFVDNKQWVPEVLKGKKVNAIFLYGKDHQIIESRVEFTDLIFKFEHRNIVQGTPSSNLLSAW